MTIQAGVNALSAGEPLRRSVVASLRADFVVFLAGAVGLAAIDGLLVLATSRPSLGLLGHYVGVGAALSVWVAALAAMLLAPGRVLGRAVDLAIKGKRARALLGGGGFGLSLLVLCVGVLRPWEIDSSARTYLPVIGLGMAVLVVSLSAALVWTVSRLWFGLGALLLVLVTQTLDAVVLRSVYPRWHDAALLLALALAALTARAMSGLERKAVAVGFAVAALISQGVLAASVSSVVELGAEKGLVVPKFVAGARWLVDGDGDRFSSVLEGGDCNDTNGHIFPGQCEVAANGIDDNCNGATDWSPAAPLVVRAPRRPVLAAPTDVYFVLLDGLRADFGGAPRMDVAPEIERFRIAALDFRRAYTAYPSTFRAVASTLTSRYWRYLRAEHELFLTVLTKAGWSSELWIRDATLADLGPYLSLQRSRDPFQARGPGKEDWTRKIVDRAIAELATEGPPRMRWLHLLDTHTPWVHASSSLTKPERYRIEVAHVSRELGRFFDAMAVTERGKRAAVIVFADHGSAFGEHGTSGHGGTLYEELVHVPVFMRLPGVPSGAINGLASLLDIVPTLAHYLGFPPDPAWQGLDWLEGCDETPCRVRATAPSSRVVAHLQASAAWGYAGLPALQAVVSGQHKLIVDLDRGRRMLFHLGEDPGEQAPTVDRPAAVIQELERTLAAWEDLPGCVNRL